MPMPPPPTPNESPPLAPSPNNAVDDAAALPKGQCRYILMIPHLKGQRCGCTAFEHNKSLPGATCHCGHLSCFHVASADAPSPGANKAEIESLKQRVRLIEESPQEDRVTRLVGRISDLEETMERNKEDAVAEIKGAYRNSFAAWQMVQQLQTRVKTLEDLCNSQAEQMARVTKELDEMRNRQLEMVDINEVLEERLDNLEATDAQPPPQPPPEEKKRPTQSTKTSWRSLPDDAPRQTNMAPPPTVPQKSWTVHVSLMPSKEQPFPFERDTTAYKRCLSRGLHRMLGVEGDDAQSFAAAVSREFGSILKDRPWMPLRAKICDAAKLQGLPMLRPLEGDLAHGNYDKQFLRENCAVLDGSGKMESLYVALVDDTLPWSFLRDYAPRLEGLESSWEHDALLDEQYELDHGRFDHVTDENNTSKKTVSPAAGIPVSVPMTSLKRAASEMSCSTSLDESDSQRKVPRACGTGLIEVRRGIETAR